MFTSEEVKAAKQTRQVIIDENIMELKAVYMAGEICMLDELQGKVKAYLNLHCVNPDDTGSTQAEHFQEALKLLGVTFTGTQKGWVV